MALRDVWVANGLCRSCGGEKRCGTYCDECRNYYNDEAKARYKRRGKRRNRKQQAGYARRRGAHLRTHEKCSQCGGPAILYRCKDCTSTRETARRGRRAMGLAE
jgi:hypothetical protein